MPFSLSLGIYNTTDTNTDMEGVSREYYGFTKDENSQIVMKKSTVAHGIRIGFITVCIAVTSICSLLSAYQVMMINRSRADIEIKIAAMNNTIHLMNEYMIRDLKPRMTVIDRVVTYQLPTTILKAFELSYNDLRSTMEQVVVDTEKLIGLYKAILGFQSDWTVDPTAQRLRCYWEEYTVDDYILFNDADTIQMIEAVNRTLSDIDDSYYDFEDVASEIKNAFYGLYDYIRGMRSNNTSIMYIGNDTVKQVNYYLNSLCKAFKDKKTCSSFILVLSRMNTHPDNPKIMRMYRLLSGMSTPPSESIKLPPSYTEKENAVRQQILDCILGNSTDCTFGFRNAAWGVSIEGIDKLHRLIHPLVSGAGKSGRRKNLKRSKRYYVQGGVYQLPTYEYKEGNVHPKDQIRAHVTPPPNTLDAVDDVSKFIASKNPLLNYKIENYLEYNGGCFDQKIPQHTIRYCRTDPGQVECS